MNKLFTPERLQTFLLPSLQLLDIVGLRPDAADQSLAQGRDALDLAQLEHDGDGSAGHGDVSEADAAADNADAALDEVRGAHGGVGQRRHGF